MATQHCFCRDDDDWRALAERLKYMACPHCRVVGALIRHGHLYGYDEGHSRQQTVRAHRIFCSNRNARPGCGRTFSVWLADKIRRLTLTANAVWRFLQCAALVSVATAIRAVVDCQRSDRTWQRLWRRFDLGQSNLRTALAALCPPPDLPACHRPAAHVVAHLQHAFPHAHCPIAAFQHALQTFFF